MESYNPYQRYFSFRVPEEPLSRQSRLEATISLYVSDLESLVRQDYRACMNELQGRIAGFNAEIGALGNGGYHGRCRYVDDPLFEIRYDIPVSSEIGVRTAVSDLLTTYDLWSVK